MARPFSSVPYGLNRAGSIGRSRIRSPRCARELCSLPGQDRDARARWFCVDRPSHDKRLLLEANAFHLLSSRASVEQGRAGIEARHPAALTVSRSESGISSPGNGASVQCRRGRPVRGQRAIARWRGAGLSAAKVRLAIRLPSSVICSAAVAPICVLRARVLARVHRRVANAEAPLHPQNKYNSARGSSRTHGVRELNLNVAVDGHDRGAAQPAQAAVAGGAGAAERRPPVIRPPQRSGHGDGAPQALRQKDA